MNETENTETKSSPPGGAQEVFLVLGGFCFAIFVAFVWSYAVYGEQITRGLDAACAEAAYQSGLKLEARGNHHAALLRYRQAMEGRFTGDARRFACGRAIGDLLMRQQRYAEAIEAYETLPPEAFGAPGAYAGWVEALWREDHVKETRALGGEWLRLAEEAGDTEQQTWAHHALMRAAEAADDLDTAYKHGSNMLALQPGGDAHMHLVRVLKRMGRYAEAKGHLEAYLVTGENPILREEAERVLPEMAQLALEKAADAGA